MQPDDEAWAEVAPQLAGKRLNASGTDEALVERWTTTAAIYRLRPHDDDVRAVADGSLADAADRRRRPHAARPSRSGCTGSRSAS